MGKLIIRLLLTFLILNLGGVYAQLYASKDHAPPATPAPAPPPPAPAPPAGITHNYAAVGPSGCGAGAGWSSTTSGTDPRLAKIQELRNKAADYRRYAKQYEQTADKMRTRLNEAKRGRRFTQEDTDWMEGNTVSEVGGRRGEGYHKAPTHIQGEIDDYETKYAKHNISYGIISGTMTSWATLKKMVGYQTQDETVQEGLRIRWATEVGRAHDMANRLNSKAQELENEANNLEQQMKSR